MIMMNKVRVAPNESLFELVEYTEDVPKQWIIHTVDKQGLIKFSKEPRKDFEVTSDNYLKAGVETSHLVPLEKGSIIVKNTVDTLFGLLIELSEKGAYFIPSNGLRDDKNYKGEGFSSFANVRVSSSTMTVSFSIFSQERWFTSVVLRCNSSGHLEVIPFYIALPITSTLSSTLPLVGAVKVNGVDCNLYEYDKRYSVAPVYKPMDYTPLPVINYLHYNYMMLSIAVDFVSDLFETKGIVTSPRDYPPREVVKSINVIPSIKSTSKARRSHLYQAFCLDNLELDDFVRKYKVNELEWYTFALLSRLSPEDVSHNLSSLLHKLRARRSLFGLLLMEIRCREFLDPLLFAYITNKVAPGSTKLVSQIVAQGGCRSFTTSLKAIGF